MKTAFLIPPMLIFANFACGQDTVCDLFKDLEAHNGQTLPVRGELILSANESYIGAADCDHKYSTRLNGGQTGPFQAWPTALLLRPGSRLAAAARKQLADAERHADRLRAEGKWIAATGSFSGILHVSRERDVPGELIVESVRELRIEELPDPDQLPVIPICDLFHDLAAWKGKRIAVRGEVFRSFEGAGLGGNCEGTFQTGDYKWPVALNYGGPAWSSEGTSRIAGPRVSPDPPRGLEKFRGRNSVTETAVYVGRLRMRQDYQAVCRAGGDWITNGFGHMNHAPAELMVEAIYDRELTAQKPAPEQDESGRENCRPPNFQAMCTESKSLLDAAGNGCADRVGELLATEGIDSKDGSRSTSLDVAIRRSNAEIVRLLLDKGAPVNPRGHVLFSPLEAAANQGNVLILKMLIKAGADVNRRDDRGDTYMAGHSFFNVRVLRTLLDAGADVNSWDSRGQTALMRAAGYGYEEAVRILIDHHADVNLKDRAGRTALMHAAVGQYVDAIPLLLDAGADAWAKDADGATALDLARKSHNEVAGEMLSKVR